MIVDCDVLKLAVGSSLAVDAVNSFVHVRGCSRAAPERITSRVAPPPATLSANRKQ